ncbi:3-oxosteroid 1-dehydrogenase [Azoarcus sp. Aa7]|nr:3-oxosteroid 1-dehydrogenase [Azoarcus sp. Aa7]
MADKEWDACYDFVIVGSGGGSMVSALVAKDHGKSVLILEKQAKVGGSTGFSGGVLWIPANPLMAREGLPDSCERARAYFDAAVPYSGPGSTPERREAYLRTGPEMVEYLQSKGMKFKRPEGFSDYYDHLPGGEPRSRSLVAELFDINELKEWKDRLSIYPGAPLRLGLDELPGLLLMKRTWKGKAAALRLGLRLLLMRLSGKDLRGAGGALQGRMLQIALRENIPIWPNTPVSDFIVDDGRVTGVVAHRNGAPLRIQARNGVLINAGGFARNLEMRRQYGRQPASTDWTMANPGDTGEMIQATLRLDATVDCMDTAIWGVTSLGPGGLYPEGAHGVDGRPLPFGHHFDISFPHVILVDQDGQRFCNEAGSHMDIGEIMYEHQRQAGRSIPGWAIIESRHRERYLWGSVFGKTPDSWLSSGYMIRADSIEDLARQCNIDLGRLHATIERFNGFCRSGVDADFQRGGKAFDRCHGDPTVKPNPNLGAIEKPPFFAVRTYPSDVGTFGGLVTDADARVLRKDGSPIPGLYATGNSTASVMGRTYVGGGASIGASFIFGYRAALHAVG